MLRTDINWPDHRKFKSNTEYEPLEFFSECLRNSKRFDFFLGFFSSSAIRLLSSSFATFIHKGGKVRLIINNILSQEDKNAIYNGENGFVNGIFNTQNLKELRDTLSKRDQHFFECLSWMIANDRIEFKIIKPKDSVGISHAKEGVFYDDNDMVSFTGSCNFSKSAIVDNIESISTFCSWDLGPSWANVSDTRSSFEKTFSMEDENVEYLQVSDIITQVTEIFGQKEMMDLLKQEQELINDELDGYADIPKNKRIRQILTKAKRLADDVIAEELDKIDTPHFPFPQGPRDYQKVAFENWKNNGQKGLFAMATGTGKTITALNCLLEIYNKCGYYKAILLVPTIALVEQWEEECRKFSFNKIIKVCSKTKDWREQIERLIFALKYCSEVPMSQNFIIICTYSSFTHKEVFAMLNGFNEDRKKMLFVADEVHNMGAKSLVSKLGQIIYLRRIGLSATPERQFDDSTNKKVFAFFGVGGKFTYEYSMQDAINNNVLCRYYYYPHIVQLTDNEMEHYVELSMKISRYFNYNTAAFDSNDEILKALLLARKRIIHKAFNKLAVFNEIMSQRYHDKGTLRYSMVYVPEGNIPEYFENSDFFDNYDEIDSDCDSEHLIDVFTEAITKIDKFITVREFVSGQKDRDAMLQDFAAGKIQVLTSMKCLDEGIDIPRSELAVFCSSTGNPRQFIQRRGRVLRKHKDKQYAILHDLVVVPVVNSTCGSFKMEQLLLKQELQRVKDFSLLSENPSYTQMVFKDVLNHYGLNIYNNSHIV